MESVNENNGQIPRISLERSDVIIHVDDERIFP